jgi:hypothetical protein
LGGLVGIDAKDISEDEVSSISDLADNSVGSRVDETEVQGEGTQGEGTQDGDSSNDGCDQISRIDLIEESFAVVGSMNDGNRDEGRSVASCGSESVLDISFELRPDMGPDVDSMFYQWVTEDLMKEKQDYNSYV